MPKPAGTTISPWHATTSGGTLDATFGPSQNGKIQTDFAGGNDYAYAVAIDDDGWIIVVGQAYHSGEWDLAMVRYDSSGVLDTTFGNAAGGKVYTNMGGVDYALAIALQPDGKIVTAGAAAPGATCDFAVARYNSDGTLDATFDADGKVTTNFGSTNDYAYAVAIQSDGKIVVAGYAGTATLNDFAVARYNTDGSLDTSFSGDGKLTTDFDQGNDYAYGVAIEPDGKIVVAGRASGGTDDDFALACYNPDGSLYTDFGTGGKVQSDFGGGWDGAQAIAVLPRGDLIVAGQVWTDQYDFAAVRYFSPLGGLPVVVIATPTDLTATPVSTTQIDLSWSDNATTETAYQIERSPDGTTWTLWTTLDANAATYSDSGLTEGAPYYYRVRATNAMGYSGWATTAAAPLLATPTGVAVTAVSGSQMDLQWDDNSANEGGYSIQQLIGTEWQEVSWTLEDATIQTVAGTYEPETEYSFRVQAWSDWSASEPSNVVTVTTGDWPLAPTELSTTVVSGTEIDLSWVGSLGAETYNIEQQVEDSGEWTLAGTVDAPETAFDATGLTPGGTAYLFRVSAVSEAGASAYCVAPVAETENEAPTVATAPSAGENPVYSTGTTLNVLGADDGGESNLTYTWMVDFKPTGADAWFDDSNGTNEAKNTSVTFTKAGSYTLGVMIKDRGGEVGGKSVWATVPVNVVQTYTTLKMGTTDAALLEGMPEEEYSQQQFGAAALDQFGNWMTTQPTIYWSLGEGSVGSISSSGMYTAPTGGAPASFTVTASAGGKSATANVAVKPRADTIDFDGDGGFTGSGTQNRHLPGPDVHHFRGPFDGRAPATLRRLARAGCDFRRHRVSRHPRRLGFRPCGKHHDHLRLASQRPLV